LSVARAWCALLTCAALCASSTAYAQARAGASAQPNAATNSGADEPGSKETAGSNPCPRFGAESPEDTRQFVFDKRVAWVFAASSRMCMESVRSDAVALAWSRGVDEHGVPLDAAARAAKLAEMEGWLRRLKGKYRIEGHRWNKGARSQVLGTADCFGIGSGPGVSCVISADWKSRKEAGTERNPKTVQNAAIRPQILLFGLDPGAMEIRVTHVDSIAVEMRGILQDGAVMLSEQSDPEILDHISYPVVRSDRETAIAMMKGTYTSGTAVIFPTPLSRYRLDHGDHSPKRLSRIAMTQGGEVDMKFYLLSPLSIWGGTWLSIELGEPQISMGLNPPIEFDLQLHREQQIDVEVRGPVEAADFTCAKAVGSRKQQGLDVAEDAPAGVRKELSTGAMQAWLARLVGQYSVEGTVDLCGQGNPSEQRPVTGKVDCIAAGSPPSTHCKVNVHWPPAFGRKGAPLLGGVSHLAPAQFLFSFFTREQARYVGYPGTPPREGPGRGLQFLQLDNRGIADGASSRLIGDAFMSSENCMDIPGDCQKFTRITARPDSNEISMQVDVEMNGKRVLRQAFLLRRESRIQKNEQAAVSLP
jgi:hypothetical protein